MTNLFKRRNMDWNKVQYLVTSSASKADSNLEVINEMINKDNAEKFLINFKFHNENTTSPPETSIRGDVFLLMIAVHPVARMLLYHADIQRFKDDDSDIDNKLELPKEWSQ